MFKKLLFHFIEDVLRNISGPIGIRLRRAYYGRRLKRCGSQLVVDTGVYLSGLDHISIGDWVWIDKHCVITAGPLKQQEQTKQIRRASQKRVFPGEVQIGTGSHLGIGMVVQGHGGVSIGERFCSSAGVKVYSLSNDPYRGKSGPVPRPGNIIPRIETPVSIGENVWLGLNVSVIGGQIEADCFIKPGSVITGEVPANAVASGPPLKIEKARYRDNARVDDRLNAASIERDAERLRHA